MTSKEFAEWIAYENLTGPMGEQRADIRSAIVAQTVANTHRTRRRRPYKIKDFIPEFKPVRSGPIGMKELKIKIKHSLMMAKKMLESRRLNLSSKKPRRKGKRHGDDSRGDDRQDQR